MCTRDVEKNVALLSTNQHPASPRSPIICSSKLSTISNVIAYPKLNVINRKLTNIVKYITSPLIELSAASHTHYAARTVLHNAVHVGHGQAAALYLLQHLHTHVAKYCE